jgi:hypothetical protein
MSNKILFIFEGEKTEDKIVNNLQKFFLNESTVITCAYCNNLYQLYKDVQADEDLDTFVLLKNIIANQQILQEYKRSDFAEIYMFFDYDGHDTQADDAKLKKLLDFFNEETDRGKLYISYPMVEALKHISDYETFKDLAIDCKKNIDYKNVVHNSCLNTLRNFNKYDIETWKQLINVHLKKMNFVVNSSFGFPIELIFQDIIFSKQLEKYININSTIAVLSAFPIFLHDYYGNEEIKKRIA